MSNIEGHYFKEFCNDKCLRLSIANTDPDKMELDIQEIKNKIEKNTSEFGDVFRASL
jgi:hypothetical protein